MREVPGWDKYFRIVCHAIKSRSKDPNTQVGAVLVDDENRILGVGYNGQPAGEPEDWDDKTKDSRVIHAEINCLRYASATYGKILHTSLHPCPECADEIIDRGVKEVVFNKTQTDQWVRKKPQRQARIDEAKEIMQSAGVLVRVSD